MIVDYAVTFSCDPCPPMTYRGTLTEDQALTLVALLLDPLSDSGAQMVEIPSVSLSSSEPSSTGAVDPVPLESRGDLRA